MNFILLPLLIAVADALARYNSQFATLGVAVWLAGYAAIIAYAGWSGWELAKGLRNGKSIAVVLVAVSFVAMLAADYKSAKSLSGEAAVEITCALDLWQKGPVDAWKGTCLYGYPARQYFLPMLPSLIGGRSMAMLKLGGAAYAILGMIIWGAALYSQWEKEEGGGWAAGTILALMWHFYYFVSFLFYSEQSAYPASIAMIAAGAFLNLKKKYSDAHVSALILAGIYLAYAYTPGLAAAGLAAVVLAYWGMKKGLKGNQRIILFLGAIIVAASIGLSFGAREDVHIFDKDSDRTINIFLDEAKKGWESLTLAEQRRSFATPVGIIVFLGLALLGGTFMFGLEAGAICWWAIAVVLMAIASKGFYYYEEIGFRLHRANVAIPAILSLASELWRKNSKAEREITKTGIFCSVLLLGIFYASFHLDARTTNYSLEFTEWGKKHIDYEGEETYLSKSAGNYDNLVSAPDSWKYFLPKNNLTSTEKAIASCQDLKENPGIWVLGPEDNCYEGTIGEYMTHENNISLRAARVR